MTKDRKPATADLTRRRFLQGATLTGAAVFLAACGPTGGSGTPASAAPTSGSGASGSPGPAPSEATTPTGPLQFANWDAYIDVEEDGVTSPTLVDFQAEYDVEVDYANAQIEDNESFMATIRPQLEAGVSTGLGHHRADRLDGGQGRRSRLGRRDQRGERPDRRSPTSATS